jgi:hypothetical protein
MTMAVNTEVDKMPWRIAQRKKTAAFEAEHGRRPDWFEYQKLHNFVESDYDVKEREWKMLDYLNPAWVPALPFGGRE